MGGRDRAFRIYIKSCKVKIERLLLVIALMICTECCSGCLLIPGLEIYGILFGVMATVFGSIIILGE